MSYDYSQVKISQILLVHEIFSLETVQMFTLLCLSNAPEPNPAYKTELYLNVS
jgi:hypothetical protein